jgi:hypothetical protein
MICWNQGDLCGNLAHPVLAYFSLLSCSFFVRVIVIVIVLAIIAKSTLKPDEPEIRAFAGQRHRDILVP